MLSTQVAISIFLAAFTVSAELDKPALRKNLDDLKPGLMYNLHPTESTQTQWQDGYLPQACIKITQDAKLDPKDVSAYSVQYSDCDDPWIMCWHKDTPDPVSKGIDMFGRLPVATRQWVRHMVFLPDPEGGHAYNSNGNIAMFANVDQAMTVFVHESGHSLDLLGAYSGKVISNSSEWLDQYDLDSNVPDNYSRTNQVENVAQNTVVASYNENVFGGFGIVEYSWEKTSHQYYYIQAQAKQAGGLLDQGGKCTKRLENSPPTQVGSSSRIKRTMQPPNVALSQKVEVIIPSSFDTRDFDCVHNHAQKS